MPSKKKKYNARFPPARIKKIMQTDEEVGKVAAAVPVIISRALELFVESLVKKAGSVTMSRNAKTLTTSHIKQCVLADSNFEFLRSLVEVIPDVQGEEESATFEGQPKPSDNSYHSNSSRGRKPRSRTRRASGAGPSHSNADESETWSAEDEDGEEEVSADSESETASDHLVVSLPSSSSSSSSSVPQSSCSSTSFAPGRFQGYFPQPVQCNTTNSADEDYDL